MSNKFFYVHNGLSVGNLTVDAETGNLQTTGILSSTNATVASSTVTGALRITGGAGIGGDLYVGGNIYDGGNVVLHAGNVGTYAVTGVTAGTDTAVAGTVGNITVWNTSTLQTVTNRGAVTTNAITINNSTNPTTSTNGALVIGSGGGIGVAGNAMIGGAMQVWGATTFSGPVTFNGTATNVYSTNTFYTDNLLNLHVPPGGIGTKWTFDDGKDIGLVYHYYNRATSTDTNAALVLADESQYLEWYSAGSEDAQGDFTGTITYGTFKTGAIILTSTSTGTSGGAGALQVAGGIYAGGSSYIGGNLTVAGTINATISGTTNQANNLNGGSTGTLVYQSAPNTSAFLSPGSAGQVLISNGAATVPSYISQSALSVGTATNVSITANNGAGPNYITFFNTTTGVSNPLVDTNLSYNASTNVLSAGQFSGSGAGLSATSVPNSALQGSGSITVTSGAGIAASASVVLGGTLNVTNVGVTSFSGGTTGLTPNSATTGSITLAGVLDIDNGGTNNTTLGAAGTLAYSDGTKYNFLNSGTTGFVLLQGANTLTWSNGSTLSVGNATNLLNGAIGQIPIQTAAGQTAFIPAGVSVGQLLQWGTNTATWVTASGLVAGNATTATNLAGGFVGGIAYQQAPGITNFIATGTVGTILQMGANGTATFVSTSSVAVAIAGTSTNLAGSIGGLIPIQSAAGQTAYIATGTLGGLLVQGTNTATFVNTTSVMVGFAGTATNNAGGAAGQIQIQTAAGQTAFMPAPTATGQLLQSNGTTSATFVTTASVMVGAALTATNLALGAAGNIPYQTAAGATSFITNGTSGQILQSAGAGAPTYVAQSTLSVGTATNVGLGAIGQIPIQTAAGQTAFIPAGASAGQLLQWGTNTATWVTASGLTAGNATSATNLVGGVAGAVPYQSAPNTTLFSATGTTGQVLVSGGTGAPVFQSTLTLASTVAATTTQTGALQVAGGVGVGGNIAVGGQLILTSPASAIVLNEPALTVGTSAVTLDTFSTSTYRSAKYVISVSNAFTGLHQSTEALVIHNGTTAFIQANSVVSTTTYGLAMTFDAVVVGNNVELRGTGTANTNTVKVHIVYITI